MVHVPLACLIAEAISKATCTSQQTNAMIRKSTERFKEGSWLNMVWSSWVLIPAIHFKHTHNYPKLMYFSQNMFKLWRCIDFSKLEFPSLSVSLCLLVYSHRLTHKCMNKKNRITLPLFHNWIFIYIIFTRVQIIILPNHVQFTSSSFCHAPVISIPYSIDYIP